MKFTITLLLTFFGITVFAQQVKYLNKYHAPVADSASATFLSKTFKNPNTLEAVVRTYYLDGVKLSEEQFSNIEMGVRGGITKTWHPNGQLKHEINYLNNSFHGDLKSYYPNGQLRRNEKYSDGKLVEGRCFTRAGSDTTYYQFQTLPQFPGGETALMRYIRENIKRPLRGHPDSNKSGLVLATFIVTPEGKASEIIIRKGLGTFHDKAVKQLIEEMPKWKPGKQEGENFPITYLLPVRF